MGHKVYPYLLRGMEAVRPNQVWAMDITYIPMTKGFVYLTVVLDWFSRRVLWGLWRTVKYEEVYLHAYDSLPDAPARSDGISISTIAAARTRALTA